MAYQVKEEICLNSDRSAIVACDSPEAHFKLTPPFGHLEDDEAQALGLVKAKAEAAPVEPVEEDEEDEVKPVPAKAKAVAAPAQNKAKSMGKK